MSNASEQNEEEQQEIIESEPEFEEERSVVKPEVVATGLSNIRKTAGKTLFRMNLTVRVCI